MTQTDYATQIHALAQRLDRLLDATQKLAGENQALKLQFEQLALERNQLQSKNDLAKHRVEAMIVRLNELERNDE
jgi:cell division protein ZapB